MFGDWIRRTGFWTLDKIRGGKIHNHYLDVKRRIENCEPNMQQLEKLLAHAVNTTPYYNNCNSSDFYSFPIITKNDIKENWEAFHSTAYKGSVHKMSTSGSTGTPFTMEWDMNKRMRQQAELVYFNEMAEQKLGQPFIYFRVWSDEVKKSKLQMFIQNLTAVNIRHLDEEALEKIRERLKKRPYINYCLGYASTFESLIRHLQMKGDIPDMYHTASIVTSSEVMSMEMKKLIKKTMGCNVYDRYSNEENGFLAQTDDLSDEFKVNVASFKIEILKQDSDEPADIGEVGRIVVTDLYNFAVPLIRYDTGDLAIKGFEKDGWTTMLKSIQGRRVDMIFDTAGRKMTAHVITNYMWKYDKLKQYQFIQEDEKQYTLKLNGAEGIYNDEEITNYLKTILGSDAEITIQHVEGIPVLASGKFKKTVCNYVPKA